MSLKTIIACILSKHKRHRLTDIDSIISALASAGKCGTGKCGTAEDPATTTAMPRPRKRKSAPAKNPKYKRLDHDKRVQIETLKRAGFNKAEIARKVGCSPSTIGRELKRNKSKKGYRAKKADGMARHSMLEKAAKRRKMTETMWREVKALLELGWTPEMICQKARRDGKPSVCRELIYQEYYRRQKLVLDGLSDEVLPLLPKRRKQRKTRDRNAKKYTKDAGRGKIKDRVDISQRPTNVLNRKRVGHWEGDLINGLNGTGHIVTLVERMTRWTLKCRVPTKGTDVVMAAIIGLLGSLPQDLLKTLTFDNGKEFAGFKQLEQALGLKVYFAKPYHSWERGTNENRNGVVRMVLPKGRAFDNILEEEMRRIDYLLNDRPLRCLDWRTPREAFNALLKRYLLAA